MIICIAYTYYSKLVVVSYGVVVPKRQCYVLFDMIVLWNHRCMRVVGYVGYVEGKFISLMCDKD